MIQGSMLRDAMISASHALSNVKQAVDALNVFPVPDGDTGTNMSMTLNNAARELMRLQNPTATEVADVASAALLRGARGNSGVILSLLFRGFSKGLKGKDEADGVDLATALTYGVEAAYKAVMKPTEGTILTVSREAAKAFAETNNDPIAVWEVICAEAEASLERTPELLPQLKKAGVVDAGGKGFCVIIEAMLDVFKGGEIVAGDTQAAPAKVAQNNAVGSFDEEITFTYCTEFIVARDPKCKLDPLSLRAYLESIGDCVVVVDDEEIIKVHVHTNNPGKAMEEAIKYGQFETVKVENMRIQHENAGWVGEEDAEADAAVPKLERVEPENDYGFVAVAAGDGLHSLFQDDLACDQVVSGGQTMNPSTDDILSAIQATPAKTVFVLPNNKNIILAAEQAVPLADRQVVVLPTRTIPQGIAAMLAFNPDEDVDTNSIAMQHAADNVSTGSVTFAARDSDFEGHKIQEGQILALDNGKLSFVDTDVAVAAPRLARRLVRGRLASDKEVNFITMIYGEGISEEEAEDACENIRNKMARMGVDVDVSAIPGGQPVYYYFISVE